ncbi:MAG: Pyruvate,phosphate dikinase, partial [uncultured Gemmatimonadaceae bacterium]
RAHRRRPPRDEPDARTPGLPPRHHLPRDHRDAGAGHLRGRGARDAPRPRRAPRDHDPPRRHRRGVRPPARDPRARRRRGAGRDGRARAVPDRHDDRAAARGAHRRRDRRERRLLLVRHQRPHADHVRAEPRRRRPLPPALHRQGHPQGRPVPGARRARRGEAREVRRGRGAPRPPDVEGRHLRRARGGAAVGGALPHDGLGLRLLLAVPRAGRAARRRTRRARCDRI